MEIQYLKDEISELRDELYYLKMDNIESKDEN